MPVEVAQEDGSIGGDAARLIDFSDADPNDWLAMNQFTVITGQSNRRPDVVLFVKGLPLAVIELKNSSDENATREGASNRIWTYKDEIPSLFRTNAALMANVIIRINRFPETLRKAFPKKFADLPRWAIVPLSCGPVRVQRPALSLSTSTPSCCNNHRLRSTPPA